MGNDLYAVGRKLILRDGPEQGCTDHSRRDTAERGACKRGHRFGQCVALHSILPILRDCLVMETAGTQFESTALAAIPLWNWCRQVLRLSTVGTSIFWPTPAERQRHGSSTTLDRKSTRLNSSH